MTVKPSLASLADVLHLRSSQIYFYESFQLFLLSTIISRCAAGGFTPLAGRKKDDYVGA